MTESALEDKPSGSFFGVVMEKPLLYRVYRIILVVLGSCRLEFRLLVCVIPVLEIHKICAASSAQQKN